MAANDLFDDWTTYEKVVANDYMHHRDFLAALIGEIDSRPRQPLRIVDLGCGDCIPVIPLLQHCDAAHYVGIDQSEVALARASENLQAAGVSFSLRCGSMFDELRKLEGGFDLAIASYSLHHLEPLRKQAVLAECQRVLEPDGLLAIVDVFRESDEDRESYLRRWEANARTNYAALDASELQRLLAHVWAEDLPETTETYRRLGEAAGFGRFTAIARDNERLNRLVVLT